MEYQLKLLHADGGSEHICDPHNEKRSPGAFGDKSVIEFPGYSAPQWWSPGQEVPGERRELAIRSRPLRARLPITLWSAPSLEPDEPAPLLIAHDGPEYDKLSSLTGFLHRMVEQGHIPPHRAALVPPAQRDLAYSASAAYARSLAHEMIPALLENAPTPHGRRMRVGMGASLGALAMLHTHRRSPATFGGLYLQSGSYFRQRFDKQESGFVKFRRISRFIGEVLTAEDWAHPIPVTMTCGTVEENLFNNRAVAKALGDQGYGVELIENRDAHNWVGWRDTFEPHLARLLGKLWS
jgi:enterochelin esterase family protein